MSTHHICFYGELKNIILKLFLYTLLICSTTYANNKGADQSLHPCSFISAYVVHTKHSIIPTTAIAEISRLLLASLAELASLSQAWSYTLKVGSLMTVTCSTWGMWGKFIRSLTEHKHRD